MPQQMNNKQLSIVVGKLLGNSVLDEITNLIIISESSKTRKEYVDYLYSQLEEFAISKPAYSKNKRKYGFNVQNFQICSDLVYAYGDKCISNRLYNEFNEFMLSYWCIDKIRFKSKPCSYTLSTYDYNRACINKIQSILKTKFEIDALIHKNRTKFEIVIAADSRTRFLGLITETIKSCNMERILHLPEFNARIIPPTKSHYVLNQHQKDIIVGTLLGDASIPKSVLNHFIKFEQHTDRKLYVQHLYEVFKPIVGTGPKKSKDKESYYFRTYRHPCFNRYYNAFYAGKEKFVPREIEEWLNPRVLAYWVVDDGSFKNESRNICTQNFTLEDNKRLQKLLLKKFNLQCTIQKDKAFYKLYIRAESIPVLYGLIEPYLLTNCMRKKAGLCIN